MASRYPQSSSSDLQGSRPEEPFSVITFGSVNYLLLGDSRLGQLKHYDTCRNIGTPYFRQTEMNYLCRPTMTVRDLREVLQVRYPNGLPLDNVILLVGTYDFTKSGAEILREQHFRERINKDMEELHTQLARYPIRRLLMVLIPVIPRYDSNKDFRLMWNTINNDWKNHINYWQQQAGPLTRYWLLDPTNLFEVPVPALGPEAKTPILSYFCEHTHTSHRMVDLVDLSEEGLKTLWTAIRNTLNE